MSTVALVSCVKSKRPGCVPAQDLYTSTLFRLSRRYAELHADRWFVLSAKHGLIEPHECIASYDETLKDMAVADRRAWAQRVAVQIRDRRAIVSGDTVLWLAGVVYSGDLKRLLSDAAHNDPMAGLPIGKRLGWLHKKLRT